MAWLPQTRCYIWGITNVQWKLANWKWSECAIVREIMLGVDATTLVPQWMREEEKPQTHPWLQEEEKPPIPASWQAKRGKFLEILCKIKGVNEISEKRRINEDVNVTIDDVKLVLKEVAGVELITEQERINYGLLPIHRQK